MRSPPGQGDPRGEKENFALFLTTPPHFSKIQFVLTTLGEKNDAGENVRSVTQKH